MKKSPLKLSVTGLAMFAMCGPIQLEAATNTWVGGSGDWNTASNWSTGSVPGPNDSAVIGAGSNITVTHSSGSNTVSSVQSQQAFVLSGGTLVVSNTFLAGKTFTLAGGSLQTATVVMTNKAVLIVENQNAVLNGVVVNGLLDVGNTYNTAVVTALNGLTLNGTALIGNPTTGAWGQISFVGTQTLSGNATVVFGNNPISAGYPNGLFAYTTGTVLTFTPSVSIEGQSGRIGAGGNGFDAQNTSVTNRGTIWANTSGGTIYLQAHSITNAGNLSAVAGATLNWDGDLNFNGAQSLTSQPGGTIVVGGNILGNPASPAQFNMQGTLSFGSGSHELEVMSADVGNVAGGYIDNFAYGGISLMSGAQVTLVDLTTNTPGGLPECVYVNSLSVASGASLNLNGLNLYARLAEVAGTVTNGAIVQAPDNGGAIVLANTTSGAITNAGALADWTFFGRAGERVAVAVDTGSANILAPQLDFASVQLFGPSSNLLAQASNTVSGQLVLLNGVTLPADGTYSVQVRPPANHASSAGNYQITVWDVTPVVESLVINQQVNGLIATPYSVDQWNFSGAANQQITFDLLNTSAPGVAFNLSGPNGWVGFTNLASSSGLITLPSSGGYTLTAYGTGGAYDINFAFELAETAETNIALGTSLQGELVGSGQAQLIEINITNSNPMRISLALGSAGSQVELYAKVGSPPTPSDFDYSYQGVASQTEDIIIPSASQGSWYILIYGVYVPQVTLYSLEVIQSSLILESYAPNEAGSGLNTALSLNGAGFNSDTVVQLAPTNGGSVVVAQSVTVISSTEISAFFASNTIPPGTYTVCASSGAVAQCLTNLLTVIKGGQPDFHASFFVPSVVGYHQPSTLYVYYANTGTAPMPAPLLLFTGTQSGLPGPILTLQSNQNASIAAVEAALLSNFTRGVTNSPPGFTTTAQILASGSVPGLLQPGESNQVPIYYAGWLEPWNFNRPPLIFTLGAITAADPTPINWTTFGQQVRPAGLSDAAWGVEFTNLQNEIGPTWGGYVAALDSDATSLWQLGLPANTVSNLFAFELKLAQGLGIAGISGYVIDAVSLQPLVGLVIQDLSTDLRSTATATTGANGAFALTGLNDGVQKLTLSNYFIVSNSTVTISNGINVIGLEVLATKACQITGYVTNATAGQPLTNVLVQCASQTTNLSLQVLSGAGGLYNFPTLPAGTYTVSCSPPNFISNSITGIVVTAGQTLSNLDLNLAAGAVISGTAVQKSDSSDVGGVTIQLLGLSDGLSFTTTTSSNGTYQFTDIPAGIYNLESIFNGNVFQTISNLQVSAGQTLSGETLKVGGVTISGTVTTEATETPIAGASVMLYSNQTVVSVGVANSNGLYELQSIPAGTYSLAFSATNYAPDLISNIQITSVATQIVVRLGPPSGIVGAILLDGQPVSNAFVLAQMEGNSNMGFASAISGSDGTFDIQNLASGTYDLTVFDPADGVDLETNGLTLLSGQIINVGGVALPASNALGHSLAEPLGLFPFEGMPIMDGGCSPTYSLQYPNWPPPLETTGCGIWNPPSFVLPANAHTQEAIKKLSQMKTFIQYSWIPLCGILYGPTVKSMWQTFINSTQEAPPQLQTYDNSSDLVQGWTQTDGFLNASLTHNNISQLEDDANDAILSTLSGSSQSSLSEQMDISDILTNNPNQLIYNPPFAADQSWKWAVSLLHPLNIPGCIAGGSSQSFLYPNSRWVAGPVNVQEINNSVTITYNLTLYVLDDVGFAPGSDPGPPPDWVFTVPLTLLENYDQAMDVNFEVTCTLPQDVYTFTLQPPAQPPPPEPPCNDCMASMSQAVGSEDPNGKIGPAGYGPQNWVLANAPFPYTIDFENSSNATAPAQIVTVSDPLSTNFNWTTFELAEIGFGSNDIAIPPNSQFFATNVSMTYEGVEIIVQIQAGINLSNGEVYADFNSVDAATELAPPVNVGFLPPEDGTGRGMGYISYFIQPKAGLPQGTQISNIAFIQFDQNPIIATDQANDENPALGIDTNDIALVTIDAVPPSSAVIPLPSFSGSNFTVCWSGTNTGPAIVGYNLYVSTNNGPWNLWLSDTTNTCARFTGQVGSNYGFYSIAIDGAGNIQAAPANAQADTTVNLVLSEDTLTVIASPTNGGAVSGGGTFMMGSASTVTATATNGYVFANWTTTNGMVLSTNANYSFTLVSNETLVANFLPIYTLKVSASPANDGAVSGGGAFPSGSTITVTATASNGCIFINWTTTNEIVLSTNANYSFTLAGNETLVANFLPTYTLKVSASPNNDGTVSGGGTFAAGSTVEATALAGHGFVFVSWTGNATGTNNPLAVTISTNINLTANFATNATNITLTVTTNGAGGVSPNLNGRDLKPRQSYTLTATAKAGNVFSNWTGSITTNKNPLTIKAESSMALQANFIPNPYLPFVGTYNGLFWATNGIVTETDAGMLKGLALTSKGTYSATLLIEGASKGFSGSFNLAGAASNSISLGGQRGDVALVLTLTANNPAPRVTGTISGKGWESTNLVAERATNTAGSGQYTMLIPPDTNNMASDALPIGDGYALITNHAGTAKITGVLADGTAFSQSVPVSLTGEIPIYANLYGSQGLLLGWINLEPTNASALFWVHPAIRKGLYTDAFSSTNDIMLSPWTYDPASSALPANLFVFDATETNEFNLTISNNLKLGGASGSTDLNGSINLETGLLTVTIGQGAGKTTGYGVIVLNATNGGGYILGKTNAQAIKLEP
jgi:hypothetical protein